jgi:hypothetical protein
MSCDKDSILKTSEVIASEVFNFVLSEHWAFIVLVDVF